MEAGVIIFIVLMFGAAVVGYIIGKNRGKKYGLDELSDMVEKLYETTVELNELYDDYGKLEEENERLREEIASQSIYFEELERRLEEVE